ncbi:MAG: sulfatase-like hydrolase/transferase [Gammaproteobacteria bacterium]
MSDRTTLTRRQWVVLAVALLLLNAALTFRNVWPTPWISPTVEVSVELGVLLLGIVAYAVWRGAVPRGVRFSLAVVLFLLVLGRYAEVTAPALYGRPVNFYWDAQHLPAVGAMLATVAPWWMIAALVLGLAVFIGGSVLLLALALGRVTAAVQHTGPRRVVGAIALALVGGYVLSTTFEWSLRFWYSLPVTATYAQQARFLLDAYAASTDRKLPAVPLATSNLERLEGANVQLVFLESYGAVTYDMPDIERIVTPVRADFAVAAGATGRRVLSTYVESPTFGGGSWLAHISLMSGMEIRDPGDYAVLMTQKRDTLPKKFEAAGYHAIAVMPGMRSDWPEGSFYGFDAIYGEREVDYRGPDFGWWRIPDQFTFARVDALAAESGAHRPLFVFLPTINTHIPFLPVPPYQADWQRLEGSDAFSKLEVQASLARTPDWMSLGKPYADSFVYTFTYLSGYLRERMSADTVLILLGDHQPAASVTGEGARWDVPVHVVTRNADIAAALLAAGFLEGVDLPANSHSSRKMHELAPVLLHAFDAPH